MADGSSRKGPGGVARKASVPQPQANIIRNNVFRLTSVRRDVTRHDMARSINMSPAGLNRKLEGALDLKKADVDDIVGYMEAHGIPRSEVLKDADGWDAWTLRTNTLSVAKAPGGEEGTSHELDLQMPESTLDAFIREWGSILRPEALTFLKGAAPSMPLEMPVSVWLGMARACVQAIDAHRPGRGDADGGPSGA